MNNYSTFEDCNPQNITKIKLVNDEVLFSITNNKDNDSYSILKSFLKYDNCYCGLFGKNGKYNDIICLIYTQSYDAYAFIRKVGDNIDVIYNKGITDDQLYKIANPMSMKNLSYWDQTKFLALSQYYHWINKIIQS